MPKIRFAAFALVCAFCARAAVAPVLCVSCEDDGRTIAAVGARSWGLALEADAHKPYTANGLSNDVSVIGLRTGRIAKKIAACRRPCGSRAAAEAIAGAAAIAASPSVFTPKLQEAPWPGRNPPSSRSR